TQHAPVNASIRQSVQNGQFLCRLAQDASQMLSVKRTKILCIRRVCKILPSVAYTGLCSACTKVKISAQTKPTLHMPACAALAKCKTSCTHTPNSWGEQHVHDGLSCAFKNYSLAKNTQSPISPCISSGCSFLFVVTNPFLTYSSHDLLHIVTFA